MNIGERLKIARETIGYILEQVEEKTGIGVSSLSEFENSKREPKFSQLSKLAEIYHKPIDFFFSEEIPIKEILLWRDKPKLYKETEELFKELCLQYHNLELLTNERKKACLPFAKVDQTISSFEDVKSLALNTHKEFELGSIPNAALKQILEEKYYIKIFYLDFDGSAISTVSPIFGPAILLNRKNKSWRRNYDLAHELFHLLTWNSFRANGSNILTEREGPFADIFASILLLPEAPLLERLRGMVQNNKISFAPAMLDDLAREFGVSFEALLWRIKNIYGLDETKTREYIEKVKMLQLKPRPSDTPDELPERYCALAQRALKQGKLSFLQFAKYMRISYKKAQEYLTEDEDFTDEKISIPVA